jgi:hypothetical protein
VIGEPYKLVVVMSEPARSVGTLGLRGRPLAAVLGSSEASVSRLQRGRGLVMHTKDGELALVILRQYHSARLARLARLAHRARCGWRTRLTELV